MTTSIIFPVNNKGGVGKTSILTDLVACLSRSYTTGVLDFDHQASLAGTLINDHSIGNRELQYYEDFETRDVTLQEGTSFVFGDPMRTLKVSIVPSQTKVSVFPVGMLYHNQKRIKKLEAIIRRDFRDASVIGIDLPPVPDPALIMDYSLKPLVELIGDVKLFPIIVATPEQNTIEIGLKQFPGICDYLMSLGVQKKEINPIILINKLRLSEGTGIKDEDFEKLRGLGLARGDLENRTMHINELVVNEFCNNSINFPVFWLPYFVQIADKSTSNARFSFYFGTEPQLWHFPEVYKLVSKEGYLREKPPNIDEYVFAQQMDTLLKYLSQRLPQEVRPFYSAETIRKNLVEIQSRLVKNIEEGWRLALEKWEKHPTSEDYRELQLGEVKAREWGKPGAKIQYEIPATAIPIEAMVDALYNTTTEIIPKMGYQIDSSLKDGIDNDLRVGRRADPEWPDREYRIRNIDVYLRGEGDLGHWDLSVYLVPNGAYLQNMDKQFPLTEAFNIFLRNLNNALDNYGAKSVQK